MSHRAGVYQADYNRRVAEEKRDDRYDPAHPRHRELMLPCCPHATNSHGIQVPASLPPFAATALSPARIEERAAIIHGVDAQECESCGTPIPAGAAADPEWFIDVEPSGDDADEYVATIRCGECW